MVIDKTKKPTNGKDPFQMYFGSYIEDPKKRKKEIEKMKQNQTTTNK